MQEKLTITKSKMKKYTIQEVAQLLAYKTHSVYCDVKEYELLRKILKLAFPKDEETDNYPLDFNQHYGYCKHDSDNWANIGNYLEVLEIINLSDVFNDNEILINDIKVNGSIQVQTVTISKEDYDRFLMLENKAKKSDQKFLDKCAIGAMPYFINANNGNWSGSNCTQIFHIAKSMLTERNKNK